MAKALYLVQPKITEIMEYKVDKPKNNEVLVKMLSASVCETDWKIFEGEVKVRYPRVMGHEGIGLVIEKGEEVRDLNEGDKVIIDPNVYDNTCPLCREGKFNLCIRGGLLGREYDGLLREYLVVPEYRAYKIPDSISIEVAPLIQPLSTVVHAHKIISIKPNYNVLILGLGVTGLMHVQLSKLQGANVIGVSRSDNKLKIARELGADLVIKPVELNEVKIKELTNNELFDVIIDTTADPDLIRNSINALRPGGTLLLFGISTNNLNLPMYDLYYKEAKIATSRSSLPGDFLDAIRLVSNNKVKLERLISKRISFWEIGDFQELRKGVEFKPIIFF
jgi:2-desacetyl-2-hydroxyethyl bacteriochlorophyllide A dehydrogenase